MNLNDYQKAALKTARYPSIGKNLNYPILGLIGELGELQLEDIRGSGLIKLKDEAGDCLWYFAVLAYELGMTFESVLNILDMYVNTMEGMQTITRTEASEFDYKAAPLTYAVGEGSVIANIWKKAFRDDDGILTAKRKEVIKLQLAKSLAAFCYYLSTLDLDLEAIAIYNLEKLN